jgi:hypothetical protein
VVGGVEGIGCLGEWSYRADDRSQSARAWSPCELTQLVAIGLDDEEDRLAVGRPGCRWVDDGDQGAALAHEGCRAVADGTADDIEYEVDFTDFLKPVLLQIDEAIRAEVEDGIARQIRPCPPVS